MVSWQLQYSCLSCFSSPPNAKHDAGDTTAVVDEQDRCEEKTGMADVVDDTEPCSRGGVTEKMQERCAGTSEADIALHSIMTATQDSFRRQLADMRENLNKVRFCCMCPRKCRTPLFSEDHTSRFRHVNLFLVRVYSTMVIGFPEQSPSLGFGVCCRRHGWVSICYISHNCRNLSSCLLIHQFAIFKASTPYAPYVA